MIFQDSSIEHGFRARFLPKNTVLDTEKASKSTVLDTEKVLKIKQNQFFNFFERGSGGGSPWHSLSGLELVFKICMCFLNSIFETYLYADYFWVDRKIFHHILLDNCDVRLSWDALAVEL